MLPRWCGLLLLLSCQSSASDDGLFVSAMKNLLFGTEQQNASHPELIQPQPPAGGYSFHQYQQAGLYPAGAYQTATRQTPTGQSCSMPQQIGTGPYRIPRWYFNPARGRCELFYWSGCCGNGNNFQTFQSCQSVCEESPNPCAVATSSTLTQCSPGVSSCGGGTYCHVGAAPQTTVCCPKPAAVDRCQQPLNVGVGNANIQRWYFNPLTQQCQSCVYKGLQGNENNFMSKQECENSCLVNPCRVGTPYRSQGVTVQCSAANPTVCPSGHYCHVGADAQTSVCCQALGNSPCEETMMKGEGTAALTRFYYDATQRKCLAFNYLGSKGNRNNFLSREACEAICPVWINPCAIGQPILTSEQKPFHCHQGAPCSTGYFCHLGFDDATTVCCPSEGDPCTLLVKEGTGMQNMNRWFYNQQTRQCQPFTYKGIGGNENNFLLREHCEATCPVWVNACPFGDPYLISNGKPQTCDPLNENSCPLSHWCHPGPDSSTTMCCPGRTDPCLNVRSEGEGPLSLTRYYFDASSRQCVEFTFKGLKGNANNFLTQEACEAKCPIQVNPCPISFSSLRHSVTLTTCSATSRCPEKQWCHLGETKETTVCCPNAPPDPCTAPPRNPGQGDFHATRWAFEGTTRKCVPFEYKGMKGNANNFLSRESCEKSCPVFVNPCKVGEAYSVNNLYQTCNPQSACPAGHYCHVGDSANYCCPALGGDPCGQPMDRGQGVSQLPRWYWSQQQQCCLPFSYCGQKGTQNNFLTKQDCERTCYELDNPCALGEPEMSGDTNRPLQCTIQQNTCGASFWCHFGANAQTTVCCPGREEGDAICRQPMSEGTGDAQLPRWYYDLANRRCVQFQYRGREGNQNNFFTQEQCEQQCPVFTNPCNQPIPLPPQMCAATGVDTCGPSSWCHIGASPDTTVCCPSEGDPCSLPLARGTGNQFMDRWYYSQQAASCQPFTYSGLAGNQNNFMSRESCEEQCGPNPCFEGRPFAGVDGRPQTCSASANLNTCPSNHWCHIGADMSTTVCCQGASTNVCNLPMSTGEGNANLERYYFDQSTRTCRPFVYNGLKGNQNNFVTLRSCQLACQPLDNPCIGQPATTAAGQVLFCSATNKDACPVNFWCHIGATPETTVCCPGATNPCSVPLAPGTGNNGLSRWYYNPDDRQCLPFQYNGKRGNQNNFETQPECERTCPEELCLLSIDRGACGGRQTRYAFNRQTSQCVPFEYTGCGGNLNNFVSMADCMSTCGNVGFRR